MKNNPAPQLICDTLMELLRTRDYADISMCDIAEHAFIGRRTCYRYFSSKDEIVQYAVNGLMDSFAAGIESIMQDGAEAGISEVGLCYFRLMEDNIDLLKTLKRAKLMHFIADDFERLIIGVAMKTKHRGITVTEEQFEMLKRTDMYYEFIFKVAGFWRVTVQWIDENDRRSAEEMAELMTRIMPEFESIEVG